MHPDREVQRDSQWRHRVDATQERFCGAASSSIAVISMSRGGLLRLQTFRVESGADQAHLPIVGTYPAVIIISSRSTSTVVHCRQATPGTTIPGLIDTISCQAHHPPMVRITSITHLAVGMTLLIGLVVADPWATVQAGEFRSDNPLNQPGRSIGVRIGGPTNRLPPPPISAARPCTMRSAMPGNRIDTIRPAMMSQRKKNR